MREKKSEIAIKIEIERSSERNSEIICVVVQIGAVRIDLILARLMSFRRRTQIACILHAPQTLLNIDDTHPTPALARIRTHSLAHTARADLGPVDGQVRGDAADQRSAGDVRRLSSVRVHLRGRRRYAHAHACTRVFPAKKIFVVFQ